MTEKTRNDKAKARFWMFVPLLLLTTSVGGWLYMVSLAVDDPGFSVEKDYYQKASGYDEVVAQRGENERLGWRVRVESFERAGHDAKLVLVLIDPSGGPLSGGELSAVSFPTARGNLEQTLTFVDLGNGRYEARVEKARTGLWEVRLRATLRLEVFTHTLRPELSRIALRRGEAPV